MKRKEASTQAITPHLAERIDQLSIKRQEIIGRSLSTRANSCS